MRPLSLLALVPLVVGGCSIRSLATRTLADTLSRSGTSYGADDDPELVEAAVPFGLKTMEQVLDEQPQHVGLLTALARSFTQYGYAFVQQEADRLEDQDIQRSREVAARARRLYLRARDYGLRGLELRHAGFTAAATAGRLDDVKQRLAGFAARDVPLMFWTGAAWTLAVATAKDQMKLVGDLPVIETIMQRALTLDEKFGDGAIHEYFVAYDGSRSAAEGGGPEQAKAHLDRALALAHNKHLGPIVSYAESVLVAQQDRKEFVRMLEHVAAADLECSHDDRLANTIAQRRARWLLSRVNELFAE